jgi:hypothetical protein
VTKPFAELLRGNAYLPRILPFVVFLGLTACQGTLGEASRYWIYFAKTLVGAWILWAVWDFLPECRWTVSVEAVLVGIAVFAVWVGLDPLVPSQQELLVKFGLSKPKATPELPWNPQAFFGAGSPLAWLFIGTRILGSTLVVPPLEEAFYRSFLYRAVASVEFEKFPLNRFHPLSFIVTAVIFGASHNEWLAGILCAMAYQGLVLRRGHVGDAMTAHAITNCLLGLWVVGRGAWNFW